MTYSKYHSAWMATYPLTAEAFNHIETQYTAIKADIDIHSHDALYYPKATSDITFFSLSYYAGFDADLLDGYHFSGLIATVLPVGAIVIWSGTDANIPAGWVIANGGSGSPDLRNRFIVGAGSTFAQNTTGGAFATAISGGVTVGSHAITAAEMPIHTHIYTDYYSYNASVYLYPYKLSATGSQTYANRSTENAGSGGGHGHAGSTIALNNLTCAVPYYALYYIFKVS
jgi:hypothetical protein